jgi:[acyl-carrier-protein] S-malonyltransferase
MMQPAAGKMAEILAQQQVTSFATPMIANFTAEINKDANVVADLLVKQICGRVRWRESMELMHQLGVDTFIEIGPGKVLSTIAKRMFGNCSGYSIHDAKDIDLYLKSI